MRTYTQFQIRRFQRSSSSSFDLVTHSRNYCFLQTGNLGAAKQRVEETFKLRFRDQMGISDILRIVLIVQPVSLYAASKIMLRS